MGLSGKIKLAIRRSSGERFWIKKTITSSTITTAAQALTTAATGQLAVLNVIVKTDSTGLAGGTNFVISSTNVKGPVNMAVETVANLGANIFKAIDSQGTGTQFSVTNGGPTILESGARLNFNNTVAVGTGAGTIDIFVQFERIDTNAECQNA